MKSGNLKLLESSGPLQACNGSALPSVGSTYWQRSKSRAGPSQSSKTTFYNHLYLITFNSIIFFHKLSFVTKTVSLSLTHVSVLLKPCNGTRNSPILTNTSERQNKRSSSTSVSPEQHHRHLVMSRLSSRACGFCRPNSNIRPSHLTLQSATSGANSRAHRQGSLDPF
jgi:hypothetical protein